MGCLCTKLLEFITSQGWFMFTVVLLILVLFWLRSWLRVVNLALNLPGPPALPILGNIFILKDNKEFVEFGKTCNQKYGHLFRVWLTVVPTIIVTDPKDLQRILSSSKCTDKNFLYSLMHNFLGQGLITSSGYKWKSHRKYIQPHFQLNNLEMFIQTFSEAAHVMVEQLKGETEVKITSHINRCVLDILHQFREVVYLPYWILLRLLQFVLEAILGIPITEEEIKEKSPFNKGHMNVIERILRPWLLLNIVYKRTFYAKSEGDQKSTLQEFSKKILELRRQDEKHNEQLGWCFLEALIEIAEKNSDFTDEDIVDEVCTLMLAGQDSVGAAIAFTLYYLAEHQNVQEKVLEELNEILLHSKPVNINSLNKMKYLEQCIKETMRLYPSVPLIARKLSEDVKLGKHTIPAGCNIFISPYVTHRLPEYYPDPEKYDPERFSAENQAKRNPFAYIPFSAGPRNCIGYKFAILEMKTIISTVLQNYKISIQPQYQLEEYFRVTLRAKGGILLKLQPR